jgi:hypothetical protein
MPWYYAEDGQQKGPVTDEQFQSLVTTGRVRSDTLVWRDGMGNWAPYGTVVPAAASVAAAAPMTTSTLDPSIPGGVLCAECGRTFSPSEVIRIADRNVCATCKPILVQRLSEGAAPAAVPGVWISEEQLLQRDYRVEIGTALERAWNLFSKNAGLMIGGTLLAGLIGAACWGVSTAVSMFIPMANVLLQPLYAGPLGGGMMWFFLRLSRGERATVSDLFDGFSKRFVPLFLALLVQTLIGVACFLPVIIVALVGGFGAAIAGRGGNVGTAPAVGLIVALVITGLIGLGAIIYLTTAWTHTLLLIMDKNMKFWPAMQLSRKMVGKSWGMTFLFLLVAGIISGAGALACLIGMIVTIPLYYGMRAYFYDDNFRDLQPSA